MKFFLSLILCCGLAVGVLIACGSDDDDNGSSQVTICHINGSGKAKTLTVSENAVPAHLGHGDSLGACP